MICIDVIIYKILLLQLTLYPDSSLCTERVLRFAECTAIPSQDPPIRELPGKA